MRRGLIWLQLLIGWLPLWALFALLIAAAHASPFIAAAHIAFRMVAAAAALAFFVQRFCERYPWPPRVTPTFVGVHLLAAVVYSIVWNLLNSVIESAVRGQLVFVVGIGIASSVTLGMWLYIMVAGVSYTSLATERAARAEANAAKAQLAALRSQINPHFLFNALHTVVQLIPKQPKEATSAAEQLAGLLRATIEEDRDVVSVAEEVRFIERYVELERIRHADRLRFSMRIDDASRNATLPSFALQTLVENALRHAVAPRVDPTDVHVATAMRNGVLEASVRDTGRGTIPDETNGTGIKRLRERLAVLYQGKASLAVRSDDHGVVATMTIPQSSNDVA